MSGAAAGSCLSYKEAMPPLLFVVLRWLLGLLLLLAGVMHFVTPGFFVQIVPPPLPPLLTVYVSGVAEIALGLGLLLEKTRRYAAWGAIALFVAVFPANVYMATSGVQITGLPAGMEQPSAAMRWGRLPLQGVLVAWAYLLTRQRQREA